MEEGRLTPFMVFYTEHRDTVNRSKFTRPEEISKEVFRLWRMLGPERKRDYCLLSNLYAESLVKHGAVSGGVKKRKLVAGQKTRRKKDPRLPKLPVSSFMWFSRHHRAILRNDHQELSFCDIGKTVGALWKTASVAEKQPFEQRAVEDKARYTRELAEYKAWQVQTHAQSEALKSQPQSDDATSASPAEGMLVPPPKEPTSEDPSTTHGATPESTAGGKSNAQERSEDIVVVSQAAPQYNA